MRSSALMRHAYVFLGMTLWVCACGTYYSRHQDFNEAYELGDVEKAEKIAASYKKVDSKKYRFVYYLDRGVTNFLLEQGAQSNAFFEQAYIFGEDYKKNLLGEAATFLLNPNIVLYYGEDHEHLLLLYFKALNYLRQHDLERALIECRRLNIRLQAFSDRYTSKKKWRRDAFMYNLIGMIYDASGDVNNAFIAYRNAYETYQEDYLELFKVSAPLQLQKDLLRTAYQNGFHDELERFEQETGLTHTPSTHEGGELIALWNNGLGPVKDQWDITFILSDGVSGVVFKNDEMGFAFPFAVSGENSQSLKSLNTIRVVFPKYRERPLLYNAGGIRVGDAFYGFELAEDVNAIAFKVLEQRMLREFAASLIRVALREVAEHQVKKENEALGLALDIFGTVTEQADTRCWQTMPHSIYYTRVPLPLGKQHCVLELGHSQAAGPGLIDTLSFEVSSKQTIFHDFTSLSKAVY